MARNTKTTTISATIMVAAAMILVALPAGTSALSPAAAPGPSGGSTPEPFPPAPSPGVDCFTYLLGLQDCLTYVEAGSNLTKPEKKCCPELKNLVAVQPICLCDLLAHPEKSPIPIDLPKALGLPAVCKVKTPRISLCPGGAPGPAPGVAPVPSAGGPAGPSTGSSAPDGAASSPTSPRNVGQSITASQRHFLFALAIVLFISFF